MDSQDSRDALDHRLLDHRLLASFAKDAEESDPIDWSGVDVDRDLAYDLMASQIAEMFRDYELRGISRDAQTAIAISTVVKLSVENFVLNQRLILNGLARRPNVSDGG
jgi:hypothetical protein